LSLGALSQGAILSFQRLSGSFANKSTRPARCGLSKMDAKAASIVLKINTKGQFAIVIRSTTKGGWRDSLPRE
jgi:hypothetical protein